MHSTYSTMSLIAGGALLTVQATAQPAQIISLTQTPCQFVETEGGDHGYKSTKAADCKKLNSQTADKRLAAAEVLKLKPGAYTFRVTNKNVPYDLGFWVRGQGIIGRTTLPSVSGGGLSTGITKDYEITLKPGKYYFSCPLNPTPDYQIIVEG